MIYNKSYISFGFSKLTLTRSIIKADSFIKIICIIEHISSLSLFHTEILLSQSIYEKGKIGKYILKDEIVFSKFTCASSIVLFRLIYYLIV